MKTNILIIAVCFCACGSGGGASDQAIAQFWQTFEADDAADMPSVQASMKNALAADPSNGDLAGDLGMSYLYLFGTSITSAPAGPPSIDAGGLAAQADALTYLQQAASVAPTWRNYSFLGAALVGQGLGRHDPSVLSQGLTMLQQQAPQGRVFTLLAEGDAARQAPPADPTFQVAVDSYFS